ncbi:MAG: CvpA family protein [Ruthenibacterium sp.]
MENNTINITPRKGRKSGFLKVLLNLLITLVVGIVYFFFEIPAINLHDERFYIFLFVLAAVYCGAAILTSGIWKLRGQDDFLRSVANNFKLPIVICGLLIALLLIGTLLSSPILRAGAYSKLLTIEQGDFAEDVHEVQFSEIPMLDRDSAQQLAYRKLGELSDMISQFEVSEENTQINFQGRPVRATPLVYADLIKWFTNRSEGIPAYIIIDMVTQNAELVRLDEGIRYTTDEHLMRNLNRYLRFRYPTYMFDAATFEIDENGAPYWICPRVVKTIGLFGGTDIDGAVLVNAVTGESQYYDAASVPRWVDRVFTADLIIEQYDYYGQYHNGFLNSLFGQKDVSVTTRGYNYIAMDDDVYMYTGVTSVGTDQSNIGFLLTNQRTKSTKFYKVAGAEEYSAMSSAQGVVQHLNYTATFPLLLNIQGEPTYFMALKDAAGLVKMYAMVNVRQYQIVSTGSTVAECEQEYEKLMVQHDITVPTVETVNEAEGVVSEIREAVKGGDTYYYIRLDGADSYYAVCAADSELSVILNKGDRVHISFAGDAGGDILAASGIKRLAAAPVVTAPVQTAPVTSGTDEKLAPEDALEDAQD